MRSRRASLATEPPGPRTLGRKYVTGVSNARGAPRRPEIPPRVPPRSNDRATRTHSSGQPRQMDVSHEDLPQTLFGP
jgi:hypothetical protein